MDKTGILGFFWGARSTCIEEPLARSIKLYQSSTVNGLLSDHRETPCVAFDDWDHIQRLLLDAPLA
jgi:hypothetical protein